jgi:hypothetical protein
MARSPKSKTANVPQGLICCSLYYARSFEVTTLLYNGEGSSCSSVGPA